MRRRAAKEQSVVGHFKDCRYRFARLASIVVQRLAVWTVLAASVGLILSCGLASADGITIGSSSTTNSQRPSHVYDAPTIARCDVHQMVAGQAGPTQLGDVREELAAPSMDCWGASTIPFSRSVATEADR